MRTIKCDISIVTQIEEDVLLIEIEEDKDFELKDFFQLKDAAFSIGRGKRFYNVVDCGTYTTPNAEARLESATEKGCEYKIADAFVIYSLPQRIIGNLYLKFNKPPVPTKFFNSVESAKIWITELKRK